MTMHSRRIVQAKNPVTNIAKKHRRIALIFRKSFQNGSSSIDNSSFSLASFAACSSSVSSVSPSKGLSMPQIHFHAVLYHGVTVMKNKFVLRKRVSLYFVFYKLSWSVTNVSRNAMGSSINFFIYVYFPEMCENDAAYM